MRQAAAVMTTIGRRQGADLHVCRRLCVLWERGAGLQVVGGVSIITRAVVRRSTIGMSAAGGVKGFVDSPVFVYLIVA